MEMTWIVHSGRALATRVDEPAGGAARGAVVVIPALAREGVTSFRTMRALAVRCAEAGFVTYSPDLTGQGDSEALECDDAAATWRADVAATVRTARDRVGDLPVHAIGLRVGATLLPAVPPRAGEKRIAWEPVSGTSFMRRALAVRRLTIPLPSVSDGVELPGAFFTAAAAESIRGLAVPGEESGVTVVRESDRATADRIAGVSPHYARIPVESLRAIVAMLPQNEPVPSVSLPRSSGPGATSTTSTTSMRARSGAAVTETHVEVGPHALPGILTEPAESDQTRRAGQTGRAVLFTAMGAELKSGPGELWVEAARELAARGVVCVRADRRFLGDALDVDSLTEPRPYTRECIADIEDAVVWLRGRTDRPVTGVGVCSGAWSLLSAARSTPMQEIVVVNNIDWEPDPEAYDEAFYEQAFRFDVSMSDSLVDEAVENAADGSMRGDWVRRYRRLRHRLGVRFPAARARLRGEKAGSRVSALIDPVRAETTIRLIMGPKEISRLKFLDGENDIARARRRGQRVVLSAHEQLDHSMLSAGARRTLLHDLLRAIA